MNIIQNIRGSVYNLFVRVPEGVLVSASCAGVTAVGAAISAASMATAGRIQRINTLADKMTPMSAGIIAATFESVLTVLNPSYEPKEIKKAGLFTEKFSKPVFAISERLANVDRPLVSQFASRIGYLTGTIMSIATRIADFAVGVLSGAVALATFGRFTAVNKFASRHLESTAVVADVLKGVRGFINPFQFQNLQKIKI